MLPTNNIDKTIVITRPLGDEILLRDELLERGYRVIHEPLTEIFLHHERRLNVEHALLDEPDAVLITSKHGVQALALLTNLRDMFLLCVGEATANIALQLGFDKVSMTGETSQHMVEYILDCYDEDAKFLYISGEDITTDLTEELGIRGMHVQRIAAYGAIAAEALSDTLVEQLKRNNINAISFFSTRTAHIFLSLAEKAGVLGELKNIDAFCLSDTVQSNIKPALWNKSYSAEKPTLASMINCIDNSYTNKGDNDA